MADNALTPEAVRHLEQIAAATMRLCWENHPACTKYRASIASGYAAPFLRDDAIKAMVESIKRLNPAAFEQFGEPFVRFQSEGFLRAFLTRGEEWVDLVDDPEDE